MLRKTCQISNGYIPEQINGEFDNYRKSGLYNFIYYGSNMK